jgi:hypothetical protein
VQRELRRFTGHPGQQQQPGGQQRAVPEFTVRRGLGDPGDRGGLGIGQQHHDGEQHTEVTDAGDQERLHRGRAGRGPLAVMADQQVGGQAHGFPADQQQDQVAGVDHQHHRGGEQRDGSGVGGVPGRCFRRPFAAQVRDGVDLHAERNQSDGDRDRGGQLVRP